MAIQQHKPVTPGRRKSSRNTGEDLTKNKKSEKRLTMSLGKRGSGRNNQGKITVRHRGGGHKRKYRLIDFNQDKFDIPAKVQSVEYDPYRSGRIALALYADGEKRYILLVDGVKVGDTILSSKEKIEIKVGNRLPVKFIPAGIIVSNVELVPGKGGEIARSAGAGIAVMAVEGDKATLKMPSGEIKQINGECLVTVGQVSNAEKRHVRLGKAGRMRWKGIRPTVRGKAMNPVDHPHGGGEGAQPIGLKGPKTPWGKYALGVKTRRTGKNSDKMILKRRKKRRK